MLINYEIEDDIVVDYDIVVQKEIESTQEIVVPAIVIEKKLNEYRGTVVGNDVINGNAPSDSDEDEPVWKVTLNTIDSLGVITNTEIRLNQKWSDYEV